MLEILVAIGCVWITFKAIGLALRMAWGTAKILASLLFTVAIPMLIACVVFAGGLLILIPALLLVIAFGILKRCV